jgi:hypothetical protein
VLLCVKRTVDIVIFYFDCVVICDSTCCFWWQHINVQLVCHSGAQWLTGWLVLGQVD